MNKATFISIMALSFAVVVLSIVVIWMILDEHRQMAPQPAVTNYIDHV